MKGKSYLPRLIAFYGKMVEVDLDEGRITDGVCVDLRLLTLPLIDSHRQTEEQTK